MFALGRRAKLVRWYCTLVLRRGLAYNCKETKKACMYGSCVNLCFSNIKGCKRVAYEKSCTVKKESCNWVQKQVASPPE